MIWLVDPEQTVTQPKQPHLDAEAAAAFLADPVVKLVANPDRVDFRFTYNGKDLVLLATSTKSLAYAVRALRIGTAKRDKNGQWTIGPRDPEQMPRRSVPVKPSARGRR